MPERLAEIEKDVYLGSLSLAKQSQAIQTTPAVGVAHQTAPNTDYHIPLTDGEHNGERFSTAVNRVRKLLQDGDGVVVYCAAGKSRSVAVIATALAAEKGTSLSTMLSVIQGVRPEADPVMELREQGREYLAKQKH